MLSHAPTVHAVPRLGLSQYDDAVHQGQFMVRNPQDSKYKYPSRCRLQCLDLFLIIIIIKYICHNSLTQLFTTSPIQTLRYPFHTSTMRSLSATALALGILSQVMAGPATPDADQAVKPYVCPQCPRNAPLCALNLNTRQPKCCPLGKPLANNAGCYTPDNVICNNTQIWAPGTHCPCV